MKLLGERNWYMPRWLMWLPSLAIESGAAARSAGMATANTPVEGERPALGLDTDLGSSHAEHVKAGRPDTRHVGARTARADRWPRPAGGVPAASAG
jgi:hypothetical protein